VAEQIAQERDAAEREAREKETRVLSLTREIDEMNDKVEELERGRRQLQAELDELVNSQGTADKNVSNECLGLLSGEREVVLWSSL
jgi:myosin protein heavy chain